MRLGRKLSYEERSSIKIVLVFSVVFLGILGAILYPLLHKEVVFEVSVPKGQPLMASNMSIDGVSYKNAIAFGAFYNPFILHCSEMTPANVTIRLTTPGWCVDLWVWGGIERGWILKVNCSDTVSLDYYSFYQRGARESGELYWYLTEGNVLVFHKRTEVNNYEMVNFTVSYLGRKDVGYFLVSLGKG
ncbi:hypothetical protein [Thermococcus gammatolerans]|uniref:Uncharacterized protein n=1 Tax=Thermococcus gammatolerans (strain DSM 15229 / JCM 11827 / EJ3) TaxID=593117 RepID=C5A3G7_THEGJ|nr:hypothetical protein [Thermococcus gammatolerans]ACS32779.1 Conserved hypothetical protein [Thermococcus gammatolerans EJ3]